MGRACDAVAKGAFVTIVTGAPSPSCHGEGESCLSHRHGKGAHRGCGEAGIAVHDIAARSAIDTVTVGITVDAAAMTSALATVAMKSGVDAVQRGEGSTKSPRSRHRRDEERR
mmetsp:Transcript_24640/g.51138  ORF Transcript_24640/g.51138 Transcript_24640/m.51138 type:complete len:113 (+) Transcript_24640:125-463(+)